MQVHCLVWMQTNYSQREFVAQKFFHTEKISCVQEVNSILIYKVSKQTS